MFFAASGSSLSSNGSAKEPDDQHQGEEEQCHADHGVDRHGQHQREFGENSLFTVGQLDEPHRQREAAVEAVPVALVDAGGQLEAEQKAEGDADRRQEEQGDFERELAVQQAEAGDGVEDGHHGGAGEREAAGRAPQGMAARKTRGGPPAQLTVNVRSVEAAFLQHAADVALVGVAAVGQQVEQVAGGEVAQAFPQVRIAK